MFSEFYLMQLKMVNFFEGCGHVTVRILWQIQNRTKWISVKMRNLFEMLYVFVTNLKPLYLIIIKQLFYFKYINSYFWEQYKGTFKIVFFSNIIITSLQTSISSLHHYRHPILLVASHYMQGVIGITEKWTSV